MSPIEALLQRLQQHIQSQQGPDLGSVPLLSGLGEAIARPAYNAAGDIGLGLEGTQKLGNYAAGEISLPIAAVQAALGDPNHPATQAAQAALAQGPLHPQAALDALRNGGDTPTSWLAGILAMAADPANLVGLPIGRAAQAEKAAAAAARAGARATPSPEFLAAGQEEAASKLADLMRALRQNADAHDLNLARQDVLGPVTPEQFDQQQAAAALQALREKRPIEDILGIADRAGAVGEAQRAANAAKAASDTAGQVYRDVQAQKATALGEALDPYRQGGRLPRGFKATPEYARVEDETKRAVELLNPQGPQNRATFQQFAGERRDALTAARQQRVQAEDELRRVFDPQQAPVTPEQASFLSREPVKNTDIAGLNEKMNAEELATTPVRTADESGWFAEPDPAQGDIATNPVKAQAVQVANPVKAQDGSVPEQEPGYVGHMWDLIKTALDPNASAEPSALRHYGGLLAAGIEKGVADTRASYARPFKRLGLRDVAGVWAGTNIETPRNAIMDKVYNTWVLNNEGVRKRAATTAEKVIGQRIAAGEENPVRLLGPIADYLATLGYDVEKLTEKEAQQLVADLGGNFAKLEADNAGRLAEMNGLQKALVGTGLQLANPAVAITGLATAPLNLAMDMRHAMFHIVNSATHMGARTAAFEDAFLPFLENSAKDLLARAAAEGKDVSLLTGKGFSRYGEVLATDGAFSPKQVTEQLGERYGAEWGRVVQQALDAGYQRSRQVLGNFTDTTPAEEMVRRFVPFMSWSWRAYPRAAKYALEHPAVTAGLLHLFAVDREMARQEGRPGYQVGTIPINKDTPLLGLLASVFTPEQEATVRLNPLALFSPMGGDAFAVGMEDQSGKSGYQKAKDILGVVGGSFNPLIQAGAYVAGQDYSAPGAASRYAPIDVLAGQAGGPTAPTIQGPLRAARKLVSGKADTYDPVEAKAKELVFERTGLPVSDPANKKLAQEINDKTGVYLDAYRDYAQGGARRAAFNAVSPVLAQATTATTEERRAAATGMPYSYEDIQAAKDQGLAGLVTAMNAANDQYARANPAAVVGRDAPLTPQEKEDPRLRAWESTPENMMLARLAPKSYAAMRAQYKATLGIR